MRNLKWKVFCIVNSILSLWVTTLIHAQDLIPALVRTVHQTPTSNRIKVASGLLFKDAELQKAFTSSDDDHATFILVAAHGIYQDAPKNHSLNIECTKPVCSRDVKLRSEVLAVHVGIDTALLLISPQQDTGALPLNILDLSSANKTLTPPEPLPNELKAWGYPTRNLHHIQHDVVKVLNAKASPGLHPSLTHTIEVNGGIDPGWSGGYTFTENLTPVGMFSNQILMHLGAGEAPEIVDKNTVSVRPGDLEIIEVLVPFSEQWTWLQVLKSTQGNFQAYWKNRYENSRGRKSFSMAGLLFSEESGCTNQEGGESASTGSGELVNSIDRMLSANDTNTDHDPNPKSESRKNNALQDVNSKLPVFQEHGGSGVGVNGYYGVLSEQEILANQEMVTEMIEDMGKHTCVVSVTYDRSSENTPWSWVISKEAAKNTPSWVSELQRELKNQIGRSLYMVALNSDKGPQRFNNLNHFLVRMNSAELRRLRIDNQMDSALVEAKNEPLFLLPGIFKELGEIDKANYAHLEELAKSLQDLDRKLRIKNLQNTETEEYPGHDKIASIVICMQLKLSYPNMNATFADVMNTNFIISLLDIDKGITHQIITQVKEAQRLYQSLSGQL